MSTERDHETGRLAVAEQHVAEAERHIAEQLDRIEKMGGDEHALQGAEKLLVPLNAMLMEWTAQRDRIAIRIEELDAQNR